MTSRLPILLVLFAIALPLRSTPATWKEDVYDPRKPFASAFGEMLIFEKASIETTLRGFIAIGDSSPGYRAQKSNPPQPPSEWGMNLNVGLCEDTTMSSDVVESKKGMTHRRISILSPLKNDPSAPSLEIEWTYGSKVKPEVIQAIDRCIAQLKNSASGKSNPISRTNGGQDLPSPDGRYTIHVSDQIDNGLPCWRYEATLTAGKTQIWNYGAITKALLFSWSPDSRHFLFAQSNYDRTMPLFLGSIGDADSFNLIGVDLSSVESAILTACQKWQAGRGGFAPVSYVDWKTIKCSSPTKCRATYIKRGRGLDATAEIEIDLSDDHPKAKVLSIKDHLGEKQKP
jgi:hypothetical protein